MGQSNVYNYYTPGAMLTAAINPAWALKNVFPVNLPPNVTILKGNLLLPASSAVNDVQTIAFTGSPTGGTFALTGVNPVTGAAFTTAAITYATGSTGDTNIQNAINAALGTGGGTVAVSSLVVTWGGLAAAVPVPTMAIGTNGLTGGTTPSLTVTHTTTGSSLGTYTLYAGSGKPTVWLQYDCATDAQGKVTFGQVVSTGTKFDSAPAYFAGDFYAAQLPNLDANAVTMLSAHFITGALGTAGAILSVH